MRRLLLAALICAAAPARAGTVEDWVELSLALGHKSGADVPVVLDRLATAQAALFEGMNAVEPRYRSAAGLSRAAPGGSIDAAGSAAAHDVLVSLYPGDKAAIDASLESALSTVRDARARAAGVAAGRAAAKKVLELRAKDGIDDAALWEPLPAAPGVYVAEGTPIGLAYGRARPWFLKKAAQLRPPPPPAPSSAMFLADLAELRAADSSKLSPPQKFVAGYWNDTNAFRLWISVIAHLTQQPHRTLLQNARLWARCAAVATDASIAVFEAKYHYASWRPATALAAQEPRWRPLFPTPGHPEYPCAHCIVAASLAEVLAAEFGPAPAALARMALPQRRTFHSFQEIVDEVEDARVWAGAHFRTSARAGSTMGQALARYELAVAWPPSPAVITASAGGPRGPR